MIRYASLFFYNFNIKYKEILLAYLNDNNFAGKNFDTKLICSFINKGLELPYLESLNYNN